MLGRPSSYNIEGVFIIAASSSVAGPDLSEFGIRIRIPEGKTARDSLRRNSVNTLHCFLPKILIFSNNFFILSLSKSWIWVHNTAKSKTGIYYLRALYTARKLKVGIRAADPDSIRSVDPDPESASGSGSRRAKMTHKSRKNVHVLKFWMDSCQRLLL